MINSLIFIELCTTLLIIDLTTYYILIKYQYKNRLIGPSLKSAMHRCFSACFVDLNPAFHGD